MNEVNKLFSLIKDVYKLPDELVLESPAGPTVTVDGKQILMFGSYNYLNLANNSNVKKTASEYVLKYGAGTGGVRLLTGTLDIHKQLEKKVALFTNYEDSMTIASGFGTNFGVIPGYINLMGFSKFLRAREAVIFSDELNHASIVDGCRISDAIVEVYRHCDMDDLKAKVQSYKKFRKLIITDGVFSMDGDIAPIDKIIEIAKDNNAVTMVDDAHAVGVLGDIGAGSASFFGCDGMIDINMGTFSKGLGVSGGFISGKKELLDFLRITTRSYMFSDSLSPAIVGGIMGSINHIQNHPEIIIDLHEKSRYFRDRLNEIGFQTFKSRTQIVPVFIGNESKSIEFSKQILMQGLFAPSIRWPAVSKKTARIRFALNQGHTYGQINEALRIITLVARRLEVIK